MHIEEVLNIFARANPSPRIELDFTNNYTLVVAVVLSAQATDVMVNKITPPLFAICNTPEKMVALGEERLKEYVKRINYFNTKAKNIVALSKVLVEKFNSTVPNDFDALITLPGIGRKSANVILASAFGASTMAVDTHVKRVANRMGFSNSKEPEKVEQDLLKIVDASWRPRAHQWLVLHGRYICKAIKPKCPECKVSKYCKLYNIV